MNTKVHVSLDTLNKVRNCAIWCSLGSTTNVTLNKRFEGQEKLFLQILLGFLLSCKGKNRRKQKVSYWNIYFCSQEAEVDNQLDQ